MQKGFAHVVIAIIVIGVILFGGFLVIKHPWGPIDMGPLPAITPPACAQDAKQCPDGSFVGRTGPNCEFSACPSLKPAVSSPADQSVWVTYTGSAVPISFRYPSDWTVMYHSKTSLALDPPPSNIKSQDLITMSYLDNPQNLSLEKYETLHAGGSGMGPGVYNPNSKPKVINGVTFYYSPGTSCGTVSCDKYIVSNNGKIWVFILLNPSAENSQIFDQIISSIRFL